MKRIFTILIAAFLIIGCSDRPFVIVQIADAQLGFTAAEKAQREGNVYDGDLSYEISCLEKAVSFVNEMKPDAVVFTGDQVNYSDDEVQWNCFDSLVSKIDESVRVLHIPGNHDVVIGKAGVDSSPFTSRYGDDRFLHKDRNVILVGINTNLIKYDDSLEVCQQEWLEEALVKKSDDDVVIVFGHHPFFMSDIEEEDGYFQIQKSKRRDYFNLFIENGVDAVFAGHRHNNSEGVYEDIPMKTTTSVAFQIGKAKPSIRIITVRDGRVYDELKELF